MLVLIVDAEKALPEYVFAFVSSDQFFDYEMQNIGSNVKMPRADKRRVLDFQLPLLPIGEQRQIVKAIEQKENEIAQLNNDLNDLKLKKESVLKKYL